MLLDLVAHIIQEELQYLSQKGFAYEIIRNEVVGMEWWLIELRIFVRVENLGTCLGIYRSPSGRRELFLDRFEKLLEKMVEKKGEETMVIGGM